MIYCGTQNNVLLFFYFTKIIHIQKINKMVGFDGWALYHATHLEGALVNYDQSLLKEILANRY